MAQPVLEVSRRYLHGASRRVGSWDPVGERGGAMNRKPVAFGTLQV